MDRRDFLKTSLFGLVPAAVAAPAAAATTGTFATVKGIEGTKRRRNTRWWILTCTTLIFFSKPMV